MQSRLNARKLLILSLISLFLMAGAALGCTGPSDTSGKVSVVVTFYPLEFFAKQVGGDLVSVRNLVTPGVEPHDFEPRPQDVQAIGDAKVFVYNGAGLEAWAERVLQSNKPKGTVVIATEGISLLRGDEDDPNAPNPHVWLDPSLAQQQVKNIRDGLIKADAANKAVYEMNASKLLDELVVLDQRLEAGLNLAQHRTFVVNHDATGYFAKRYGLEGLAISGISPDAEPDPKTMAGLVQTMKEKQLKYVFMETLASPSLAQALAREADAQTLTFNPVEGLTSEDIKAGKHYFSVMDENLRALRIGLGCS